VTQKILRALPSVAEIITQSSSELPHDLLVLWSREILADFRKRIRNGKLSSNLHELKNQVVTTVAQKERDFLEQLTNVINATGIVLHTGLGRAPIGSKILSETSKELEYFSALEINPQGKRGDRFDVVRDLLKILTGAEDALVVNNNAAAVLLVLNSLAESKQVIVSRGEEVEIGGSFRIPDVIVKSGCEMMEVGTTNRTHLADYQRAITNDTAVLLQVHTSNFRVKGFTKSVDLSDLVALGKSKRVPVISDLGSGALINLEDLGFAGEPLVKDILKTGVSIVTFSGDKLLGGPQCGVIAGNKRLIARIRKNPLMRALRPDKFTLSVLRKILLIIAEGNVRLLPTYQLLSASVEDLQKRAENIISKFPKTHHPIQISIQQTTGQFGSGAMPTETLESCALRLQSSGYSARYIFQRLFSNSPRLLGRISGQSVLLDLRTVFPDQDENLLQSILAIEK